MDIVIGTAMIIGAAIYFYIILDRICNCAEKIKMMEVYVAVNKKIEDD